MNPTRRRALLGLLAAPVIIRTPGLLMPVRRVTTPEPDFDFRLDVAADGMTRLEWLEWQIGSFRSVDAGDRDYTIWAVARADGTLDIRFSHA